MRKRMNQSPLVIGDLRTFEGAGGGRTFSDTALGARVALLVPSEIEESMVPVAGLEPATLGGFVGRFCIADFGGGREGAGFSSMIELQMQLGWA